MNTTNIQSVDAAWNQASNTQKEATELYKELSESGIFKIRWQQFLWYWSHSQSADFTMIMNHTISACRGGVCPCSTLCPCSVTPGWHRYVLTYEWVPRLASSSNSFIVQVTGKCSAWYLYMACSWILASHLNLHSIAELPWLIITTEGLKHHNKANFLFMKGCDILQGFLYARPMEYDAFVQYMLQHTEESCLAITG